MPEARLNLARDDARALARHQEVVSERRLTHHYTSFAEQPRAQNNALRLCSISSPSPLILVSACASLIDNVVGTVRRLPTTLTSQQAHSQRTSSYPRTLLPEVV